MKIIERIPFVDPIIAASYAKQLRKAGCTVKVILRNRKDCTVTVYKTEG